MALNFPDTPTNGQVFTAGAMSWTYDSAAGNWVAGHTSLYLLPINSQVGTTYTLLLTDAYKMVEMNNAAANTLYIPTDASVAFAIGTQLTILQTGAGTTTITATTPGTTTVVGTPGYRLRTQWSAATIVKRAANYWVVFGDVMV